MEKEDETLLDYSSFIDPPNGQLLEFIELSIHHLLYINKIYPAGIFSRKQRYGVAVQTSDHPEVNAYIKKCLNTACDLLKMKSLEKILVLLIKPDQTALKTFTFDLGNMKRKSNLINNNDMTRLELSFRDAFLRLSICDRKLQPYIEGCSYKLQIATSEESYLNLCQESQSKEQYEFPWVQSENKTDENRSRDQLIPLSSVDSNFFTLQVYAKEMEQDLQSQVLKCQDNNDTENSIMSQEY